jgi:hypothetical protein
MIHIPKIQEFNFANQLTVGVGGRHRLKRGKNLGYMDAHSGLWVAGRDVVLEDTGFFNNLITTTGMDALASGQVDAWTYHHVGSGTATPTNSDTTLGTWIASTNTNQGSSSNTAESTAPYFSKYVKTRRFAEGDAAGNVAEVGVSTGASNTNMCSRARVVDGGGNPTTITVLSDEWLDHSYEFRLYPDHVNSDGSTNDGTGTLTMDSVNYGYTIRPINLTSSLFLNASNSSGRGVVYPGGLYNSYVKGAGATLSALTTAPGTLTGAGATITNNSYTPGSFSRTCDWSFGLTEANISGIALLVFSTGQGSFQLLFDTVIPKDDTKIWTYTHTIAWARATIS